MKEKLYKVFDYAGMVSLCFLIYFVPISNALIETFFGFILLFFVFKKILKPDFSFLKSKQLFFLLSFFIFSSLSLYNSGIYLEKSLKALFLKWLEYLMIFVITADTLSCSKKRIHICLFVMLISGCLLGIDGLSQKFIGLEFLRNKPMVQGTQGGQYGVTASFSHYNDFGTYLVFLLSAVLAVLISVKNKILKIFLYILTFLLFTCLIFTFSRASWIGFFIVLSMMLFFSRKFKEIMPIVIIFVALLISFSILRERVIFTFEGKGDADRFIVWRVALKMILENPFLGKGIGTFMDYFYKYMPKLFTQYAHNCYLQVWAETGIFSLLSFLAFLGLLVRNGLKVFVENKDFLLLGLISGVSAFLFQSFFDTQLYSLQLSAFFWLMAGMLFALSGKKPCVHS